MMLGKCAVRGVRTRWACVIGALAWCFMLSVTGVAMGQQQPPVRIIQAPDKSLVPDVAMDAKGVLHMVYGLDHSAYYVRSTDNGANFTAPVKVNSEGTVETEMGERGPKLSVGDDGSVHIIWVDDWNPGVKTFVRYSRSLDGGRTFEPRKTLSSMNGIDGVTMAADGKGHVLAFWHVMQPKQDRIPEATWLWLARSTDNGATFAADEQVKITNFGQLACSMCMMRARIGPDGTAYLAFRTAEDNIRDFYVLKGKPTENSFVAVRVNQDNWELKTCPMCGPELTFEPGGRALCAFMSRHRVYWAVADERMAGFKLHVATPANENDEIYPTAVANRKGQVLLLWQVGPMSTKSTAIVKWATYDIDGKPTGQQGTIGKSFSGTKPTAFVGTDDEFYIVTTAKPASGQ